MLKPYNELTDAQKKQVAAMYFDLTDQEKYLYDFDANGQYHGRQRVPFKTEKADATEPVKAAEPVEIEPAEVDEPAKPKRKPRTKK